MAYVNFGRKNTKAEAVASANKDKIFFPTDSRSIILAGKEYGSYDTGTTPLDITSSRDVALAQIEITVDYPKTFTVLNPQDPTDSTSGKFVYVEPNMAKQLFFTNESLDILQMNGEAYYQIAGRWYSYNIRDRITFPTYNLMTTKVGAKVKLRKVKHNAQTFFDSYIDFSSISISDTAFKLYKASRGYANKSDGEFIKFLITNGEVYAAYADPNQGAQPYCLVEKEGGSSYVVLYTADLENNTDAYHTGDFWPGNCANPGIYSLMTSGRPPGSEDGENYLLFVDKDGAQSCCSVKHPDKWFRRNAPSNDWEKVPLGGMQFPTRDVASIGDPNKMLESGVYAYEWIHNYDIDGGIDDGRYDIFVERSSTADSSGYYAIKQVFASRSSGKGYLRVIFRKENPNDNPSNNPIIPLGDEGINVADYCIEGATMPYGIKYYYFMQDGINYHPHCRMIAHEDMYYLVFCALHNETNIEAQGVYFVFRLEESSGWIFVDQIMSDVPTWILNAFGENTYTKEEVYNKEEVYTKEEIDNKFISRKIDKTNTTQTESSKWYLVNNILTSTGGSGGQTEYSKISVPFLMKANTVFSCEYGYGCFAYKPFTPSEGLDISSLLVKTFIPDESGVKMSFDEDVVLFGQGPTNTLKITTHEEYTIAREEDITFDVSDDGSYVDLGLPSGLLWATCNVGAEKPEDIGLYFQWGSLTGHDGTDGYMFSSTNYPEKDLTGDLTIEHDAARAYMGGTWRMPTLAECQEICDNCTYQWTTLNGVNGYMLTSKINGKTLFLPAAGYANNDKIIDPGLKGRYRSTTDFGDKISAYAINFSNTSFGAPWAYSRAAGNNIRGVTETKPRKVTSIKDVTTALIKTVDDNQASTSEALTELRDNFAAYTLDTNEHLMPYQFMGLKVYRRVFHLTPSSENIYLGRMAHLLSVSGFVKIDDKYVALASGDIYQTAIMDMGATVSIPMEGDVIVEYAAQT